MKNKENSNTKMGFPFGFGTGANLFTYPVHSSDHVIYIDDLSYLEEHQERLQAIRQATPDDSIRIVINSPGGVVSIAMAYVNAIAESQAQIVTHAEGSVCSAGTILWLACEDKTVAPLTEFMFHNYQGGIYGDGANMLSRILFEKKYFDRLMGRFYEGVLTSTELDVIKGGGQVWMDEEMILTRTKAVLLDSKNIKRLQRGQPPICSPGGDDVKVAPSSGGAEQSILMSVGIGEEEFKINLADLKASDFDGFNMAELNLILGQLKSLLSEDVIFPGDNGTKREVIIAQLIKVGGLVLKDARQKLEDGDI